MQITSLEALIMDRLLEAQIVMRYSSAFHVSPSTKTTFWPETSTSERDQWYVDLEKLRADIPIEYPKQSRPPRPSAAAISRMEETWVWMAEISNHDARKALAVKVFSWVYKVNSTEIAKRMGIDRKTLNRRFNRGIEELMLRVCKKNVFLVEVDEDLVSRFRPNQAIRNRNIAANAA